VSYLFVAILILVAVLLMLILAALQRALVLLASIREDIRVSEAVEIDADIKWPGGFSDSMLRKIADVERGFESVKKIDQKIDLLTDILSMSPEERRNLWSIRRAAANLRRQR
jgi:hypothetical protein